MESVEKQPVKIFLKRHWRIIKPLLLTIAVIATMLAVIFFTYRYFTCVEGSIPADRIVDDNAIKKSDWLGFWGCVLGVLSTIIFSLLSWKQNNTLESINNENRKREIKLSTMSYISKCYSKLSLGRVAFCLDGANTEAVMFEFQDQGEISPHELVLENLEVQVKIGDNEKEPIFILDELKLSVDSRMPSKGTNLDTSVIFNISKDAYNNLFEYTKRFYSDKGSQIMLLVNMNCKINNPMNVTSNIKVQASFGDVKIVPEGFDHPNEKEKILFTGTDHFIKTMSYEFVGKFD